MGQTLSEIEKYEDPRSDDEGDDALGGTARDETRKLGRNRHAICGLSMIVIHTYMHTYINT